jgi:hypothetical protein
MVTEETDPREALRQSQAERARAADHLERVRAAIGRAQNVLAEIIRQAEDHSAAARRDAEMRADKLLSVIRSGADLSFDRDDRRANVHEVQAAADQGRRASAEKVVAQLRAEEFEAARVLERIEQTVALSIRRVMWATAAQIADRWTEVSAEAQTLRRRVGRPSGNVWRLGVVEGTLLQAIMANDGDELLLAEHSAIEDAWTDFASRLVRDPDARVDFAAADSTIAELRAEREEHRVGVSRILAEMAAERRLQ